MFSRKILSSVLSLAMAGVMVVPAFATSAVALPGQVGDDEATTQATAITDDGGSISIDSETIYNAPVICVTLPTKLSFAIDPYEIEENGQINSPNFYTVNYSNVPVRLDAKFWMEPADDTVKLDIKSTADDVNGATEDGDYDIENTDLEIFAQVGAGKTAALKFIDLTNSGTDADASGDYYKVTTASGATTLNFAGVELKTTGYTPSKAKSKESGTAGLTDEWIYDDEEACSTITGTNMNTGDYFSLFLEKGTDAIDDASAWGGPAFGLMRGLHKQSASTFRLMGSINPAADWSTDNASSVSNKNLAKVKFGNTFKITALGSIPKALIRETVSLTSPTVYFAQSSNPVVITNATKDDNTAVNLLASKATAGTMKIFLGKDAESDGTAIMTGVSKVVIKDLPQGASAEVADKELTTDEYEFTIDADGTTGTLKLNIQTDADLVAAATTLIKNTAGYDVEITTTGGDAKTIKGKVVFLNK